MRRLVIVLLVTVLLGLTLVAGACAPKEQKVSAADFYKSNTVTLICSFGAGGGFDIVARIFAAYWPNYAGGPMVVDNMTGGAGIVGHNYIYKAKPDGLTIGISNITSLWNPVLYKDPGVEWDPAKFAYIGWFVKSPAHVFGVGAKSPYTSMADLQKAKGLKGGAMIKDSQANGQSMIAEWFKLDYRIIGGFKTLAEAALAAGRGEVDAITDNWASYREFQSKGLVKTPFLVLDPERDKNYGPDVPTIFELLKFTPEMQSTFDGYLRLRGGGRIFFTPPGVPEDRVQFIEDTFMKIYADEAARKQIQAKFEVVYPSWTGEQIGKEVVGYPKAGEKFFPIFEQLVTKYWAQ